MLLALVLVCFGSPVKNGITQRHKLSTTRLVAIFSEHDKPYK